MARASRSPQPIGGREAVDARQHDQEQRDARQARAGDGRGPGRGRRRPRRGGGERRGPPCSKATPPSVADPMQQGLLQDQHEGRRHDVAGIAAGRIEQRLVQDLDRRALRQRRAVEAAVGARIARQRGRPMTAPVALEDALQRAVVEQEIGGIDIGRQARPAARQDLALGARRNVEDAEDLATWPAPPAPRPACSAAPRPGSPRRHSRAWMMRAAELRGIVVDDGDRHVADELPEIGLRIEHAVDEGRQDDQAEGAAVAEHAAIFGGEGAARCRAARGLSLDRRRLDRRGLCRRRIAAAATRGRR